MTSLLHYLTFSFEISSQINSRTRLYNTAASPASRLRSAGSLAISSSNKTLHWNILHFATLYRTCCLYWMKHAVTGNLSYKYFSVMKFIWNFSGVCQWIFLRFLTDIKKPDRKLVCHFSGAFNHSPTAGGGERVVFVAFGGSSLCLGFASGVLT